jgi:hypothetical protein
MSPYFHVKYELMEVTDAANHPVQLHFTKTLANLQNYKAKFTELWVGFYTQPSHSFSL